MGIAKLGANRKCLFRFHVSKVDVFVAIDGSMSVENVRFGSLADILRCGSDVRFTPESNIVPLTECRLSLWKGGLSREIKMPELSLAKRSSRYRKTRLSSFEFSVDQIEAVRQLVGHTIAEVECELILETLASQRGSRTNAAKLLGISIRTLRNKIHEYVWRGKLVPKTGVH
jgi:DNA-binding protein Fis